MFNALHRHPFAVKAHFKDSLVLAYAAPIAQLHPLIPNTLQLDTYDNHWGFVAVAIVHTRQLRPASFPALIGREFYLIGYRLFVRYRTADSQGKRGLYILRSETNKRSMVLLGNTFTSYRNHHASIDWQRTDAGHHTVQSGQGLSLHAQAGGEETALPATSPFPDWKSARQFAGPMPFTFSYDAAHHHMTIVEGQREAWIPRPVTVHQARIPFLESLRVPDLRLANAFIVSDVPYHWKKGVTEPCP